MAYKADRSKITKRALLNRAMTIQEMDRNFDELINVIEDAQGGQLELDSTWGAIREELDVIINDTTDLDLLRDQAASNTDRLDIAEQSISSNTSSIDQNTLDISDLQGVTVDHEGRLVAVEAEADAGGGGGIQHLDDLGMVSKTLFSADPTLRFELTAQSGYLLSFSTPAINSYGQSCYDPVKDQAVVVQSGGVVVIDFASRTSKYVASEIGFSNDTTNHISHVNGYNLTSQDGAVYHFNLDTLEWETMLTDARIDVHNGYEASVGYGNDFYILLGYTSPGYVTKIDTTTWTITELPDAPFTDDEMSAVVSPSGMALLTSGYTSNNMKLFDIPSGKWTEFARPVNAEFGEELNSKRGALAYYNNKFWIISTGVDYNTDRYLVVWTGVVSTDPSTWVPTATEDPITWTYEGVITSDHPIIDHVSATEGFNDFVRGSKIYLPANDSSGPLVWYDMDLKEFGTELDPQEADLAVVSDLAYCWSSNLIDTASLNKAVGTSRLLGMLNQRNRHRFTGYVADYSTLFQTEQTSSYRSLYEMYSIGTSAQRPGSVIEVVGQPGNDYLFMIGGANDEVMSYNLGAAREYNVDGVGNYASAVEALSEGVVGTFNNAYVTDTSRYFPATDADSSYAYMFGGAVRTGPTSYTPHPDVYMYRMGRGDPATSGYRRYYDGANSDLITARFGQSINSRQTGYYMYIVGGIDSTGVPSPEVVRVNYTRYEYPVTPLPEGLAFHTSFYVGTTLYVYGGMKADGTASNKIWYMVSPSDTGVWEELVIPGVDLPSAMWAHSKVIQSGSGGVLVMFKASDQNPLTLDIDLQDGAIVRVFFLWVEVGTDKSVLPDGYSGTTMAKTFGDLADKPDSIVKYSRDPGSWEVDKPLSDVANNDLFTFYDGARLKVDAIKSKSLDLATEERTKTLIQSALGAVGTDILLANAPYLSLDISMRNDYSEIYSSGTTYYVWRYFVNPSSDVLYFHLDGKTEDIQHMIDDGKTNYGYEIRVDEDLYGNARPSRRHMKPILMFIDFYQGAHGHSRSTDIVGANYQDIWMNGMKPPIQQGSVVVVSAMTINEAGDRWLFNYLGSYPSSNTVA